MKALSKAGYGLFRSVVKTMLQLSCDFQVWGAEHIPPGPKIYCSNHFSSSDSHFVITLMREPVHMVIGSAFGVPVVRTFLKWGEQISACSDEDRKQVIAKAAAYLRKGESVYIFPEGDLGRQISLRKFYSGMARIYLEYPVPIIPIGLVAPRRNVKDKEIKVQEVLYRQITIVSKNYYANIGEPVMYPEYENHTDRRIAADYITEDIKSRISALIDDIKTNKFWS